MTHLGQEHVSPGQLALPLETGILLHRQTHLLGRHRVPAADRKAIYTTNAIESVNYGLRRLTKHRGAFPSDEALMKRLYLALRNISKQWTLPIRDGKAAFNRATIQFEDRMPQL